MTIHHAVSKRMTVLQKQQSSKQNTYRRRKNRRYLPLYLMMLPGLLYLLVNNYIPMAGIVIAFKSVNYSVGILKSPFIGFKNFEFLFKTNDAWTITRNTILYNLAFIVLGTILAIAVSILLSEIRREGMKKTYQTMILLPSLISMVVVSYLVLAFLSSDSGFLNKTILDLMGIPPVAWYASPKYWPVILVVVYLWKSFGFNCIIYYATIVGIDRSYYESAAIDRANRWQQVWYITIPSLKKTIITLTLMAIGRIFYSDFGLFYQIPQNSGPLMNVTNTIDTYVYRGLTQLNDVGMAAAAGVYQSVIGFVLVLTVNFVVNRISKDDALF